MAFGDFHTHTIFSDGFGTVEEMVDSARAKGLLALGISDHSMTPFDLRYCMRPETNIEKYEPTVREAQKKARELHNFPVLLGIEWDYGSEIERERYDYTIGSVHYIIRKNGDIFPVDSQPEKVFGGIEHVFGGNRLDFAKAYFEQVVTHAEKNKPTFMGHFDLLTKHQTVDEDDEAYLAVVREALSETIKHVPLLEINMGAVIRGLRSVPYPHPKFLPLIRELGGKVILSSDAHHPDKIAFQFPEMLRMLADIGFTHVSRLTENGIVEDEIATLLY
ncbi:MAG: PHP domain-containing protein [Ruminococcaceae bacterium]|nr:PHP domain-containing protein [Oscillospiraceae bacterium]